MLLSLSFVALGALASLVAAFGAYRVGRVIADMECIQLRSTCREMMQYAKERDRQIDAIQDRLSMLAVDPRTHAHTKLELEKLKELTAHRES